LVSAVGILVSETKGFIWKWNNKNIRNQWSAILTVEGSFIWMQAEHSPVSKILWKCALIHTETGTMKRFCRERGVQ
jgi:hypothetical protein